MEEKELYEEDREYKQEETLELTDEQIAQLLSQPALTLDTSNVEDIQIHDELFYEGVCDVSDICGSITALVSVGLTPAEALDYILNRENIAYNLRATQMNNETSIKIAQINAVQAEKTTI